MAPAIRMAEEGYAIPPRIALDWSLAAERLRKDKGATLHYLPDGQPPAVGDTMKLPALAATLKRIAKNGSREFYDTDIAQDIVDTVAPRGNTLAASDFAAHRGEEAIPISSNYRGLDIVELPPNGQGLAALVLLNILERFDIAALDPNGAERAHIALEAARLAYAVRDTHIADPVFHAHGGAALARSRLSPPTLPTRSTARKRSDLPQAPGPRGDTTLVTVVDRDRNAVSIINSLFVPFGSAVATRENRHHAA